MSHQHHAIDYIEFTVSDMKQSKEFYGSVFGWEFTDYAPVYAGIKVSDREIGGFTVGEVVRGGPLVVLFSKNLEDSLAKVRAAGAKIVKEPFDFPGGRRFQFQDPSSNQLAVWAFAKGSS